MVAALEAAPGGATEVELSGNTVGLPAMLAIVDALGRTSSTGGAGRVTWKGVGGGCGAGGCVAWAETNISAV